MINLLYHSHFSCEPQAVEPITGSGSDRKYFRLISPDGSSVIGVEGSDSAENKAFIYLSRQMASKGIRVPKVIAVSEDGMDYIQEDLRSDSLFEHVMRAGERGFYDDETRSLLLKTVSALPDIQFRTAQGMDFSVCYPEPAFNSRMVDFDLNYFKYCFLKPSGASFRENLLQDDFDALKSELLSCCDGDTFMYRDFQARNVMVRDGEPWFIDFQGGRKGPFLYDLASFVWQARAAYPEDLKNQMIDCYFASLRKYVDVDVLVLRSRLDVFVLFRSLQVLGAYGYRGFFERKEHFLKSIDGAMANIAALTQKGVLDKYPQLRTALSSLSMRGFAAGGVKVPDNRSLLSEQSPLVVDVMSFSFKKGIPADASGNGGGYVFDCRGMENPGRYEQYKSLTGRDKPVIDFLEERGEVQKFLNALYTAVDAHVETFVRRNLSHLQLCFGCTGGQHRSVYCAEHMAAHLESKYPMITVRLTHREHP